MANFILGYVIIGLILSALYIGKTKDTDGMRKLSKANYTAALLFIVVLITIFWLPIGVFALIKTFSEVSNE
jgi:branched-subunit amino acid ABC-type transport system permease component